MGFSIGKKLLY